MLPAKIKLTERIIETLKAARISKRIPAAALARIIERDDSYVSSLESGRLRTISSNDFVAILRFLHDIPEHEAIDKAEYLIESEHKAGSTSNQDTPAATATDSGNGAIAVSESPPIYQQHDAISGFAEPELINDMLHVLSELIHSFFVKDPKEAVYVVSSFIKTMQFDAAFAMNVLGIPFFALRELNADERKAVLNDLFNVYSKHLAIGNKKTICSSPDP